MNAVNYLKIVKVVKLWTGHQYVVNLILKDDDGLEVGDEVLAEFEDESRIKVRIVGQTPGGYAIVSPA